MIDKATADKIAENIKAFVDESRVAGASDIDIAHALQAAAREITKAHQN